MAQAPAISNIVRAAKSGNLSWAKQEITGGANPGAADQDGSTALMWASMLGRCDIVEYLFQIKDARMNPGAADIRGKQPSFLHQSTVTATSLSASSKMYG